tara:strand:- start:115 stop:516 length:402 start_codon:yes stop_codon:yes gene_type:complete
MIGGRVEGCQSVLHALVTDAKIRAPVQEALDGSGYPTMTQASNPAHTMDQLDAMSIESAQVLSFDERNALLDLIIAEGRYEATGYVSYRTGMYTDYFDEDLTRILKMEGVKVYVRDTTSANFDGEVVGYNSME